jgi:hypothetical protein
VCVCVCVCVFVCPQDCVRSLCFHPTRPLVVSTSDDCTARAWHVHGAVPGTATARKPLPVEPTRVYRGHTDAVLCCAVLSAAVPKVVPLTSACFSLCIERLLAQSFLLAVLPPFLFARLTLGYAFTTTSARTHTRTPLPFIYALDIVEAVARRDSLHLPASRRCLFCQSRRRSSSGASRPVGSPQPQSPRAVVHDFLVTGAANGSILVFELPGESSPPMSCNVAGVCESRLCVGL